MSDIFSNIFGKYGIKSLLITIVLAIVIWFIAHISAAPGTEVSILWGLVRYTKPIDDNMRGLNTERKISPVEKNEETKSSVEDSSLSPISIFIKDNLTKNNLEEFLNKYRAENKVRELKIMESGKKANELPDGIYSFVSANLFNTKLYDPIKDALQNITLSRFRSLKSDFEIHIITKQNILVLGFVAAKDASEISFLNGTKAHSIVFSPRMFDDFSSLAVIPADRIIYSNERSIDVSQDEWYNVLDLEIK